MSLGRRERSVSSWVKDLCAVLPAERRRYEMRFGGWQVYANKSPDLDGVTKIFCPPPQEVCRSVPAVNLSPGWPVPARRGMGWVLYRN